MSRQRLDELLVERKHASGKQEAFILVTAGRVLVNGQKALSPAQLVGVDDRIEVRPERKFVGRGAYKLEAAIREWGIDVRGKVCADVGAATGGFTEVLLKHGAAKVYAIDVGRGKLDMKLREDPRVVVMEETNVLSMSHLAEKVDLVTIDVSFTSLRLVLPVVRQWLSERGRPAKSGASLAPTGAGSAIALFKPQYELEDKSLLKHGILRDQNARRELVERFRAWLRGHHWQELKFMESPIRGSEGNAEYLFYLQPN